MLMQGLNVLSMVTLASLLPTLAFADQPVAEDCTHSISKLEDVADALRCKHITLGGFSVTTRQTLNLELRPGATVEMTGDLNFDNYKGQSTPMIILKGANITFNGNNHNIRCNGDKYWPKTTGKLTFAVPAPVMSVFASGIMQNFTVFNSPRQAFFIGNIGRLKIKNVNVDNTAGKGRAANTDGFDIKAKGPLEISGCTIDTQDDCFAISGGNDTSIHDNKCVCTHGISIGSVQTGYVIRNTYIGFNTLQSPVNALRIKAMLNAKDGIVENVTYEGNIAFNVSENGFMLVQNYTNDNKHGQRPTNGVLINKVHFISENTLYLDSGARPLNVVCAPEACPNEPMGLENVKFIGGGASVVVNAPAAMQEELKLVQTSRVPTTKAGGKQPSFHKPASKTTPPKNKLGTASKITPPKKKLGTTSKTTPRKKKSGTGRHPPKNTHGKNPSSKSPTYGSNGALALSVATPKPGNQAKNSHTQSAKRKSHKRIKHHRKDKPHQG